ncbi:MAG: O-antigen ligase family protein [Anaerolineales bacterium]|nr:O-antigen ligase family protein [Anaerolineales bacterium]
MRILRWIDQWHWVFIAIAAPFLLFPSVGRSFAMVIVPGVWIIGLLARRKPLRCTPLNPAILLLAVMVLVSLYATYDFAQSFSKITGMVLAFGVFFATARKARRLGGWWGATILFGVMSLGMAAFGLLTVQWSAKIPAIGSLISRVTPRLLGLQGAAAQGVSANELAGALVWGIPVLTMLSIALLARRGVVSEMLGARKTILTLLALIGATIFLLAILVLTQSRGGYLGLLVTFAAILFFVASWRWRAVMIVAGIIFIIAAIFFLRAGALAPSTESASALSAESAINTLEGRLEIWSRAIYGIEDFAFTGMGMNTFRRVVHVLYPLFLIGPDSDIAHAHNEFLQAGLDLGVPGLIAFASLYVGAAMMLGAIWTRARALMPDAFFVRAVVLGLGAGLLAHLVYGMTDAVALGAKPGVLFWLLLGLIAGLYDQAQSGRLQKWYDWFGAADARTVPPFFNPESLDD